MYKRQNLTRYCLALLVRPALDRNRALRLVEQGNDLVDLPDVISDAYGNGRSRAEGLVDTLGQG